MRRNKLRLLLIVVFALAAGFIITSRINKTSSYTESTEIKSPETQKDSSTQAMEPNIVNQVETTEVMTPEATEPSNYLTLIPECLSIEVRTDDTLKSISSRNNWNDKDPKKLIRQNLIYKKNNNQLRVSLLPSENNETWTLQSFNVDAEGLPIPKNKVMGLQYHQLSDKIKVEVNGANLISDEQNMLVKTPTHSGSILFINDEPIKIKLFNKANQRLLECQGTYCVCNQALNS